MKKQIEILTYIFGILLLIILVLNIIEKTKKVVKTETVNCEMTLQVDINTDTTRTFYKDKLIIVTGRNKLRENYNVRLSELIDSQLLTKPESIDIDGSLLKEIKIKYSKIRITYYDYNKRIYIHNNDGIIIYFPGDVEKRNKISPETLQNINVIIKRYMQ